MHMIDRRRVQNSFGRQAHLYENYAVVQRRVIDRFSGLLKALDMRPESCLDVGAGSGMLLRSVREIYGDILAVGIDLSPGMTRVAQEKLGRSSNFHMLAGDAEHLPFIDASYDLLVSTSTFQWLENLMPTFSEAFRVLKPGGTFAFSLFGEATLRELRSSYRSAVKAAGRRDDHTHNFFSVQDVASALSTAGFTASAVTSEEEVEVHRDVGELLRSLKRIGAGNATPLKQRGLQGRSLMQEMMARYHSEFGTTSGIPATYEIIYGRGRKPW